MPAVVHSVQMGHHAPRGATEASGEVLVPSGQHGSVGVKVGAQHLVVPVRSVVVERLLGVVDGAQAVAERTAGQRGQALTHPAHVFVVGAVEVVHGR